MNEQQILTNLMALWESIGGSVQTAPVAASIAWTESSGNPNAVCYDYTDANGNTQCSPTPVPASQGGTGQEDIGLFQIANLHAASLGVQPSQLFDPTTNAKAAFQISGGGVNWGAWGNDQNSPRFQSALLLAEQISGTNTTPSPAPSSPSTSSPTSVPSFYTDPVGSVVGGVKKYLGTIPQFQYWYIPLIALGLLIVAYVLISRNDDNNGNGGNPPNITIANGGKAASESSEAADAAELAAV